MKNVIRKLTSVIIVTAIIFGSSPLVEFVGLKLPKLNLFSLKANAEEATSGTCGENLTWTFDEATGILTISGTGEMMNWGDSLSDIPWYSHSSSVKTVNIENGVTSIGNAAFYSHYNLTKVTIADSVTTIGSGAFMECTGLVDVTLSNSLTTIGDFSFASCESLKSIIIPYNATTICMYAFVACISLKSITIPDSVTTIGDFAFSSCTNLTSVTLPDNLTEISTGLFSGCINLISITIPDGVTTIGDEAFENCVSFKDVSIPDSVTNICDYAFRNCGLTCITIPDNVITIGSRAFSDCYNLKSITIPDSISNISMSAFYNCNNLKKISVDENNAYYSSDEYGVLYNKDKTLLIHYPAGNLHQSFSIPDTVITIGMEAFRNSHNLRIVIIPYSVTTIEEGAFYNCNLLISINIPDSVTYIGQDAFTSCSSLKSIALSNNLTSINYYTFAYCTSLTQITIPDSVTIIDGEAFSYCDRLESITIPDGVTYIGCFAFSDCDELEYVHIPASVTNIDEVILHNTSVYICSTAEDCYAKTYADEYSYNFKVCEGHSVEKISSGTCGTDLTWTLDKESGVLTINGTGAMTDYTSSSPAPWAVYSSYIKTVNIYGDLTCIGNYAFQDCYNLENIALPNSVETIGNYAFASCCSLINITIPDSVTIVGEGAFQSCCSLINITIPDSVINLGVGAFIRCDSLTSITVDKNNSNYLSDESGVLFNKDKTILIQHPARNSTTKYIVPDSVTTIDNGAFLYCTNLISIIIPDNVTTIGGVAFGCCDSLESIIIPNNVTTIVDMMFFECNSLMSVIFPDSLTNIGDYVFYFCENLEYVHIPINVRSIGGNAFYYAPAYICSTTEDSYAKTYADEIGIDFKLCTGHKSVEHDHTDSNSDGLCDICNKMTNVESLKDIYISITTPKNRTINYMESVKLYVTTANLPEGYKIKWKVEGDGVSIKPSTNGKICTVTSTSTGNVVIKAYVVDSLGNIVTDENGKQVSDSEYFYSDANLWLRIVYFLKKLFGISVTTAQLFKGVI